LGTNPKKPQKEITSSPKECKSDTIHIPEARKKEKLGLKTAQLDMWGKQRDKIQITIQTWHRTQQNTSAKLAKAR
jgi:hypothetical protein